MTYEDWLWFKVIALCLLAFFGNLFYSFFTGKTLGQEQNDKE